MANGIKQIELVNAQELKALSFININGTVYFGKVFLTDGAAPKVTDAIVVSNGTSFASTVREWLIAKSHNELKAPKVGGNISYNAEDLNEAMLAELDKIVSEVNLKLKYVLVDIGNKVL